MASQKKQRKRQQATPAKIVSAERIARAMELRKGGATYEMIGADLGVSTPRAFEIVNDALKALVAERRVGDRDERHVGNDGGRRFLARYDPESPGRRAETDGTPSQADGPGRP